MKTEIGSNFWEYNEEMLDKPFSFWWNSLHYSNAFFKSGRNAIKALCKTCYNKNRIALLPEYTCHTVIDPFVDEGWAVFFYSLNINLTVDESELLQKIELLNPDLVLFQSYFGFNTLERNKSIVGLLKEKRCTIVEDITQSLPSKYHLENADYYVASLRKFMAIPNGGVLITKNVLPVLKRNLYNQEVEKIAFEAFKLKKDYIDNPSTDKKAVFRQKYYELESIIDDNRDLEDICPASVTIFFNTDFASIIKRRQENYSFLSAKLRDLGFLKLVLGSDVRNSSPLYLPIYLEDRKGFQRFMAENNVYCPIVWPKPDCLEVLSPSAEYMYSHMICIPIDQRYDRDDMNRIVSLIEKYGKDS